jgi:HEAT repeat protein
MSTEADGRTVAELVAATLVGDAADRGAWAAVDELHRRSDATVLAAGRELLGSQSKLSRSRGADILARVGIEPPRSELRTRCANAILEALAIERAIEPVEAMIQALGHFDDPRVMPALAPFVDHPDAKVRLALVHALPDDAPAALDLLILRLSSDVDVNVRNWATFTLASAVQDTLELRAALTNRLTDPDPEVRGEALVGLARRKAPNAREAIAEELSASVFDDLALDAARELGDRSLLPLLLELRKSDRFDWASHALHSAIEALER